MPCRHSQLERDLQLVVTAFIWVGHCIKQTIDTGKSVPSQTSHAPLTLTCPYNLHIISLVLKSKQSWLAFLWRWKHHHHSKREGPLTQSQYVTSQNTYTLYPHQHLCGDLLLLAFTTHLRVLAASFLRFRDHTQWHNTVGRTPLD
jgi:hypothetical protein